MPARLEGRRLHRLTAAALTVVLSCSVTGAYAAPPDVDPAASLSAPAAATTPSIIGTVRSARTGDPVAGVTVTAYRLGAGGQWSAVAWADASGTGTYSFAGLTTGTYRVGTADWTGRYKDAYYSAAMTLGTATDIIFTGTTVPAIDLRLVGDPVVRVYDADRYSSAVQMVYEQYADSTRGRVDFSDVATVVLASGEDRSAADPLAASGLCYAYQVTKTASVNAGKGAPLVLMPGRGTVPVSVRQLVADVAVGDAAAGIIGNGSKAVRLVVVGGTASVPDAQVASIESYLRARGVTVTHDRIAGADRYDIAARIAGRMKAAAASDAADSIKPPTFALVANGADSRTYFDALALSPIAARNGAPVVLVAPGSVPGATAHALADLGLAGDRIWVAGGTRTVSDAVLGRLGIPRDHRLAGANRYATAVAVANKAVGAGWLPATGGDARGAVLASKLADALAGGALGGDVRFGYPMLLAAPASLPGDTSRFLSANRDGIGTVIALGGPASMTEPALAGVRAALR